MSLLLHPSLDPARRDGDYMLGSHGHLRLRSAGGPHSHFTIRSAGPRPCKSLEKPIIGRQERSVLNRFVCLSISLFLFYLSRRAILLQLSCLSPPYGRPCRDNRARGKRPESDSASYGHPDPLFLCGQAHLVGCGPGLAASPILCLRLGHHQLWGPVEAARTVAPTHG